MKINGINSTPSIGRYEAVRRPAGTYAAPETQGADKAEFSNAARSFAVTFKAVKASVAQRTPEEQRKIADIEKRIDEGAYSVDARLVAEGILRGISTGKHG